MWGRASLASRARTCLEVFHDVCLEPFIVTRVPEVHFTLPVKLLVSGSSGVPVYEGSAVIHLNLVNAATKPAAHTHLRPMRGQAGIYPQPFKSRLDAEDILSGCDVGPAGGAGQPADSGAPKAAFLGRPDHGRRENIRLASPVFLPFLV